MPAVHMVAQEHLSWVEALQSTFGSTRNHTTIAAAATAIGSSLATLVLTMAGDGVWSIGSNLTTGANITVHIPRGVTVNVAAGVTWTMNGPLIAYNPSWKTGSGTVTQAIVSSHVVSGMTTRQMTVQNDSSAALIVQGVTNTNAMLRLFIDQGGGQSGIQMSTNDAAAATQGWQFLVNSGGSLLFVRPGGNSMMHLSNTGLGIGSGQVPGALIQLSADSAVKPGTTSWQNPSDSRLKDILGDYTEGLALLRSLPQPKRYTYNGKAHTPSGGPEYVTYVAQELQAVAPQWVGSYEDKLEESDPAPTAILTVNLGTLQFAIVNALKELDARVTALETP